MNCFRTALFLLLAGCTIPVSAQHRYFYHDRGFGSDALYNPLSLILNGSFDILQHENRSRMVFTLAYGTGTGTVLRNLGSPLASVARYGWWNFLRREVLPLGFTAESGQWWPNYTLHLIGGGMTSVAMREWYEAHGFSSPAIWSGGTVAVYHMLNEIVENGRYEGVNVDPIADIWLFDIAGVVLFTDEDVCRFFSEELHLADWSLQPTIAVNDGSLQNNGQYFSIKWKIPGSESYSLFHYFGLRGLFGISRRFDDGSALSLAAGVRAVRLKLLDPSTYLLTAEMRWEVGAFYDQDNSLLMSLFVGGADDTPVSVNVYPGLLGIGDFSPGIWALYSRRYGITAGISTRWTPGVGFTTRAVPRGTAAF